MSAPLVLGFDDQRLVDVAHRLESHQWVTIGAALIHHGSQHWFESDRPREERVYVSGFHCGVPAPAPRPDHRDVNATKDPEKFTASALAHTS